MIFKILGCSGGKYRNFGPTSFVLDDTILIDCGTVMKKLDMKDILSLDSVLLSHMHFDHIADLPFLLQTMIEEKKDRFTIYSAQETKDAVFSHIFNFEIWPNLFDISKNLDWKVFNHVDPFDVAGYEITSVPVNHTVPTNGFIFDDGQKALGFTSDTYITDEFWKACNRKENLKAVIVDVSFPNGFEDKAKLTKHLTINLLLEELKKLENSNIEIYITHIKPSERAEVIQNIRNIEKPSLKERIIVLEEGMVVKV